MLGTLGHVLIVFPAVSWIVSSERKKWSKTNRILLAIAFLGLVAAIEIFSEFQNAPSSYFSVLGVTRFSSQESIKRAFREMSKATHPDKNPNNLAAQEQFIEVKKAFDVLSNPSLRKVYDKFGPEATSEPEDDLSLVVPVVISYLTWAVFAFLFTIPKSARSARTWLWALLTGLCVAEINARVSSDADLINWAFYLAPSAAIFQICQVIRLLVPSVFGGTLVLCRNVHQDQEQRFNLLLNQVMMSNSAILLRVSQIENQLSLLASGNAKDYQENMLKLQQETAKLELSMKDFKTNLASMAGAQPQQQQKREIPWGTLIFFAMMLLNYFKE